MSLRDDEQLRLTCLQEVNKIALGQRIVPRTTMAQQMVNFVKYGDIVGPKPDSKFHVVRLIEDVVMNGGKARISDDGSEITFSLSEEAMDEANKTLEHCEMRLRHIAERDAANDGA